MVAKWRDFELLAEKIMRDLMPHAEVKFNDKILGSLSEVDRQIDVSVRWETDGGESNLLIVDTKATGRPADITRIDAFASLVQDVEAVRGILICSAGFTSTALKYAKNRGIMLYNLHDAQSRNWAQELTVPILWIDLSPVAQPTFSFHGKSGDGLDLQEILRDGLSPDGGRSRFRFFETFSGMWNSGHLPLEVGPIFIAEFSPLPSSLIVKSALGEMEWREVYDFKVAYQVRRRSWLGYFLPEECRGFIDYLDDGAFVVSHMPLGEIPVERDESWIEIEDPDKVVVSLRGSLVTSESFEILKEPSGLDDIRMRGPFSHPLKKETK